MFKPKSTPHMLKCHTFIKISQIKTKIYYNKKEEKKKPEGMLLLLLDICIQIQAVHSCFFIKSLPFNKIFKK